MAFVSANGARFHLQHLEPHPTLELVGLAPPVVFVHGLVMDDLSSFYYTLAGPVIAAASAARPRSDISAPSRYQRISSSDL